MVCVLVLDTPCKESARNLQAKADILLRSPEAVWLSGADGDELRLSAGADLISGNYCPWKVETTNKKEKKKSCRIAWSQKSWLQSKGKSDTSRTCWFHRSPCGFPLLVSKRLLIKGGFWWTICLPCPDFFLSNLHLGPLRVTLWELSTIQIPSKQPNPASIICFGSSHSENDGDVNRKNNTVKLWLARIPQIRKTQPNWQLFMFPPN